MILRRRCCHSVRRVRKIGPTFFEVPTLSFSGMNAIDDDYVDPVYAGRWLAGFALPVVAVREAIHGQGEVGGSARRGAVLFF